MPIENDGGPIQTMSVRKILLLSVSAGAGHVRASEALRACART